MTLLQTVAERLTQAREARFAELAGSPAEIAAVQARVDVLDAAVGSLRERIGATAQRRARCEARLAVAEDTLVAQPKPWRIATIDAAIDAQRKLLDDARVREADLSAASTVAASEELSARKRLSAAEAERDRVVAANSDEAGHRLNEPAPSEQQKESCGKPPV